MSHPEYVAALNTVYALLQAARERAVMGSLLCPDGSAEAMTLSVIDRSLSVTEALIREVASRPISGDEMRAAEEVIRRMMPPKQPRTQAGPSRN